MINETRIRPQLLQDFEQFARRMHLQYIFHGQNKAHDLVILTSIQVKEVLDVHSTSDPNQFARKRCYTFVV